MANIEDFVKCVEARDERYYAQETPKALKPKHSFKAVWRWVGYIFGQRIEDINEYDSKEEARNAARNYCNGITIKKIKIIKVGK